MYSYKRCSHHSKLTLKIGLILIGVLVLFFTMAHQANKKDIKLEKFDDLWDLGDPVVIEKGFRELLPQAEVLEDKSIYLQILSQIALTQALQKQFESAHKTLDKAEALLTPEYTLAQMRILLERGRVFQQSENIPKARSYFEQAFELGKKHNFEFQTINVAHMIAIVAEHVADKIKWNQLAIQLAQNTKNKKAREWLGSLYNNLGQNYLENQQYEKALSTFKKALDYRIKESYAPNVRVAKWAVAHTLRRLGRLDEAVIILNELLTEYNQITDSDTYDMPLELFKLTRGLVYEELAEIYSTEAKTFARAAYVDLAENEMFKQTSPERLERLRKIKNTYEL